MNNALFFLKAVLFFRFSYLLLVS